MITHIVNMSIRQGIIPDDIKRARVIPIRKKVVGQIPVCIDLYPYSCSYISKVMEKVIRIPVMIQTVIFNEHMSIFFILQNVIRVTLQAWYC